MPCPPQEKLTRVEAQRRAPFTVWLPREFPSDWDMDCSYVAASENPRSGPSVHLDCRSADKRDRVIISQSPVDNRGSIWDEVIGADPWDHITVDGITVYIGGTDEIGRGGQAQAYFEHDGTFVFLMSETLTRHQLADIAGGLREVQGIRDTED
jgi:hypothetical protein